MAKYSQELTEEIVKWIRAGNSQKDSAALAGISEKTFYEWMDIKSEFSESIKKATYECKARNIAIIQKAAEKTWQAAAWWLERKFPDEFAIKTFNEHTGKDGAPLGVVVLPENYGTTNNMATPEGSADRGSKKD